MPYHVDDSAKGRYYMIFGRDILTTLVLNLELSYRVIQVDGGIFFKSTAPIVDMGV